jgi:hypothetical protein
MVVVLTTNLAPTGAVLKGMSMEDSNTTFTSDTSADEDWTSGDEDDSDGYSSSSDWSEMDYDSEESESDEHNMVLAEQIINNSSPGLSAMHTRLQKRSYEGKMGSDSAPPSSMAVPACLQARIAKADSILGLSIEPTKTDAKSLQNITSPQEYFAQLMSSSSIPSKLPALSLEGYFVTTTEEHIQAYDMAKLTAVRNEDVDSLRQMHSDGAMMQCCNRFGESIVHSVCRRGATSCLKFLIEEAGVSVKVIDDYGRTPFHDACWTAQPNFELIEILLRYCPGLLLIADKRGSSPLEYVRQEHHAAWIVFLSKHQDKFTKHALFSI